MSKDLKLFEAFSPIFTLLVLGSQFLEARNSYPPLMNHPISICPLEFLTGVIYKLHNAFIVN